MNYIDSREGSLKELPTKELKLKRHKDRKFSSTIPPIRLRLKSNTSLSSETDMEKCFSDRSVSSSPDSQVHSPVFNHSSPPPSPLTNEAYEPFHFYSPSKSVQEEDNDQPLDMSRKRVQEPSSQPEIKNHQQQLRPSVITCASALLRTQCNLSNLAHQMCATNMNDSVDVKKRPNSEQNIVCDADAKAARPGHRREIVSGSCDPVIDEHFRRSLGKDYQHIFSKSAANQASITVDDHFAKALGETWHQIQQSKVPTAESLSSTHSSSTLQTSQTAHILPQILS